MFRFIRWLLVIFVAVNARAAWEVKQSWAEPSTVPALKHEHLVLEDSEIGGRASLELARFPAKFCKVRLLDNRGGAHNLAEAMESGKCLAGVNGGYFDPNFAPLGLRIADGKLVAPLTHGRLLTGILVCSDASTRIIRVGEFSKHQKPTMALECGPFLVDDGRRVSGLEKSREARRTFVSQGRDGEMALGICSEVSLAELSQILAGGLGDFRIQRALNLDGGSSTAFWFRRKDSDPISISEEKTVRDFVGITAR